LFDTIQTPFGFIPESVVQLGVMALIVSALGMLCYKELVLTSFDPSLAKCLGLKVNLIHYGLLTATSLVVVGSLEAVGAVLVVGMLIVPPATARLLTQRLPAMLGLTCVFVVVGTLAGIYLAAWLKTPLAASMMVVAMGLFVLVWGTGLLAKRFA
jgi:manganese/zinc/iron transport system permease protein